MKKLCCICKRPLDQYAHVQIIPNELYADFTCMSDLLPNVLTGNSSKERKEQRQKEIELIVQNLISKHKEGKQ